MSQFKKGISQQFVDRLNAEYKAGGWWKSIADDRDLFVAIRKDYLNVYLNGNSLLKLWQDGDQLVGETHYKYLLTPEMARPYVKVVGGKAAIDEAAALFNGDLSDMAALKRAANVYSGDEKKGVHQIVMTPIEGHSKKPDIVRDKIISLAGDVPRIELFARQTTPGWDVWGNEVDSSISFP